MIRRYFSTILKTFFNATGNPVKDKQLLPAQITQKYPILISFQETNRLLEESSMAQSYTLFLLFSKK